MSRHSIHLCEEARAAIPEGLSISAICNELLKQWSRIVKITDHETAAKQIMADAEATPWLKAALAEALKADPFDAEADAEKLLAIMQARVNNELGKFR